VNSKSCAYVIDVPQQSYLAWVHNIETNFRNMLHGV